MAAGFEAMDMPWLLTPVGVAFLAIVALPLTFFLKRLLFPTFDAREPPVVRPKLPVIGHIVSMLRERSSFYHRLYRENSLPICTLPMLSGKMYVINSPSLIASAMRHKDLSFDPFMRDFCVGGLGINKNQERLYFDPDSLNHITGIIHSALAGDDLRHMTDVGMNAIASALNDIETKEEILIPNSLDWVRKLMAEALFVALFGKTCPMSIEALPDMWTFEDKVAILTVNMYPKLLAPDALAARARLRDRILPWYKAELFKNPDVSPLIKKRAAWQRELGFSYEEICGLEFVMPWAATVNTVPTFFWIFTQTHSRPELIARIREEVESIVEISGSESTGRTATLSVPKVRKDCPVLMACYQEVTRLCNVNIGNREAMNDIMLKDPATGREYLLTKGTKVQWSASVVQTDRQVWGVESEEFDYTRWLKAAPTDQSYRKSMIPFGGGKTLCPGKQFAETDIMSSLAGIVLLFDIDGISVPASKDPMLGTGVKKVVWGDTDPTFKLKRRPGWEDVKLQYAV